MRHRHQKTTTSYSTYVDEDPIASLFATKDALAVLAARVGKLETTPTPVVPPPAIPPVITPAPSGQTARIDPTTNPNAFLAVIANPAYTVIELAGGRCPWENLPRLNHPATRDILVRPAAGQKVVFVGPGHTVGDGIFHGADRMTFDGITPDGFTFQSIVEACTGLLNINGSDRLTWRNFTITDPHRDPLVGDGPVPWKTHIAYISGSRNDKLLIEYVTANPPALHRDQSGFVIGSTTVTQGEITLRHISIKGYQFAFIDYQTPVEKLGLDDWAIDDCARSGGGASVRFEEPLSGSIVGTYSNMRATNSGPLESNAPGMVAGAGSVWT